MQLILFFFYVGVISIVYFLYAFYEYTYGSVDDTLSIYLFTNYRDKFTDGHYILAILDFFVGPFRFSILGFVTLLILSFRMDLKKEPRDVKIGFRYFRILIIFYIAYNLLGFLRSEEIISPDTLSESGWTRYWDVQITFSFIGNLSVFFLLLFYPNMLIATEAMSNRVINTYRNLGLTETIKEDLTPSKQEVLNYLQMAKNLILVNE